MSKGKHNENVEKSVLLLYARSQILKQDKLTTRRNETSKRDCDRPLSLAHNTLVSSDAESRSRGGKRMSGGVVAEIRSFSVIDEPIVAPSRSTQCEVQNNSRLRGRAASKEVASSLFKFGSGIPAERNAEECALLS